jgi:hypothetical protein
MSLSQVPLEGTPATQIAMGSGNPTITLVALQDLTSFLAWRSVSFSLLRSLDFPYLTTLLVRNVYALIDMGNLVGTMNTGFNASAQAFMQLLPTTDLAKAHEEFVAARLNGTSSSNSTSHSGSDGNNNGNGSDGGKKSGAAGTYGWYDRSVTLASVFIAILLVIG